MTKQNPRLEARFDGEAVVATHGPEPFIDASRAAAFLALSGRYVLELARAGELPAYPLGHGRRRIWRFRLTDLVSAMKSRRTGSLVAGKPDMSYRTKPRKRAARSK